MSFDLGLPLADSKPPTLKLLTDSIKKANELGFTTVAVSVSRPLPLKPKDLSSAVFGSLAAGKKIAGGGAGGAEGSSPPSTLLTRVTVGLAHFSQLGDLNRADPQLASYDIVAVVVDSEQLLEAACKTGVVDIIALQCGEKMPFTLRKPHVLIAAENNVAFELEYTNTVRDPSCRRMFFRNALEILRLTKGKNVIVSSGARNALELRGVADVKAILSLLGLPPDRTAALLTANPAKVVASARARRRLPVTVIPALPAATVTATKPPPAPTATGAKPLQPAAAAKRLTTATVTAEPMSTPTVPLTQAVGGSADEARVKPTRAGASWTMAIPPNAPAAHKVQPIPATGPAAADDTRNQKRKEMKQEKKRRGAETSTPPPPLKRSNASMG